MTIEVCKIIVFNCLKYDEITTVHLLKIACVFSLCLVFKYLLLVAVDKSIRQVIILDTRQDLKHVVSVLCLVLMPTLVYLSRVVVWCVCFY